MRSGKTVTCDDNFHIYFILLCWCEECHCQTFFPGWKYKSKWTALVKAFYSTCFWLGRQKWWFLITASRFPYQKILETWLFVSYIECVFFRIHVKGYVPWIYFVLVRILDHTMQPSYFHLCYNPYRLTYCNLFGPSSKWFYSVFSDSYT